MQITQVSIEQCAPTRRYSLLICGAGAYGIRTLARYLDLGGSLGHERPLLARHRFVRLMDRLRA